MILTSKQCEKVVSHVTCCSTLTLVDLLSNEMAYTPNHENDVKCFLLANIDSVTQAYS